MGRKKNIEVQSSINDPQTQVLLNRNYNKPNFLIGAKYQSKLIDNQIIAISMANIKRMYIDEDGVPCIAIKGSEIKDMVGGNSGSFYTTLARAANRMTKRNMGVIDPENGSFDFLSVITRARYEKGMFYIYYNPHFKKQLTTLDKTNPYTQLNLKIMLSFDSVYSFRLFELIKAQCFAKKGQSVKKEGQYSVYHPDFRLAELMLDLGVVNSESDKVIEILNHKKNPDYEKAIEVADANDRKYTRWDNFKNRALDVAVNEINEKSQKSMILSYDTMGSGKGGKIYRVIFTAKVNDRLLRDSNASVTDIVEEESGVVIEKVNLTPEQIDDFIDDLADIINEKIKLRDLKTIAEVANYNLAIIEEKYKLSKTQNIDNLVGWLISAIKEDYKKPISSIKNSKNNWNFEESATVYDEELLLDN